MVPTATQRMNTTKQSLAISYFNHLESQIVSASSRANTLFAIVALLFSGYGYVILNSTILTSAITRWGADRITTTGLIFWVLAGGLLAWALIKALYGCLPKIRPNRFNPSPDERDRLVLNGVVIDLRNLHFYGQIGKMKFEDFSIAANAQSENQINIDVKFQIWGKAVWLRNTYEHVTDAILLSVGALGFGFLALLLLSIKNIFG